MDNEHMDGAVDDTLEELDQEKIEQIFADDLPDKEPEVEETEEPAEEPVEEETEEETKEETEEPNMPQVDPKTGNLIDPNTGEKLIPQSELNKIIGNARIKGREYEEHAKTLEKMTGMPMSKITEYIREQQVEKMEEEYGVPREKAQELLSYQKEAYDRQQEADYLKEELFKVYNHQQHAEQTTKYSTDKAKHVSNPLVRKYEKEIDAISQGGKQLEFETAMKYVLGEKLYAGEIVDQVKRKTPSEVSKRSKTSPEGGQGGGVPAKAVPQELKALAHEFGVPLEEVTREYEKIEKKRGL